jgi:hypothetical protein
MIAHRMSHVFSQRLDTSNYIVFNNLWFIFNAILEQVRNSYTFTSHSDLYLSRLFGTTGACRRNNLFSTGEWLHEHFAQYCVTGKIRFNPAKKTMVYRDRHIETIITLKQPAHRTNFDVITQTSRYYTVEEIDAAFNEFVTHATTEFDNMLKFNVGSINLL